jgi:aldehyde:ferredoxin oxidoreductase
MVDAWSWTEDELGITRHGRHDGAEKAGNIALHQDWRTVCNSLVACILPSPPVGTLLECLHFVTGMKMDTDEMMQVGERGWNLKRLINHRLGLQRKDEHLPDILLKPLPDGGGADYVPPFSEMMDAYYSARGWDRETGFPDKKKLDELGLGEFDFRS